MTRNAWRGAGRSSRKPTNASPACTLADAQFFIARGHGFASWPKFAEASRRVGAGGFARLEVRSRGRRHRQRRFGNARQAARRGFRVWLAARSTREHRSTLLHYVSANGVEDFRQKTPKNIVEITKLLLNAGADVNAESDAYGGRSTTLGLTATSCHPEEAGVQLPLMDLLIAHGATIDGPDGGSAVNGCLHNGRGEAAEYLANRGARLDLEAAAGVGRLDVVQSFFNDDGSLKPPATEKQRTDGFAWACEFGRTSVVDFLLRTGIDVMRSSPMTDRPGCIGPRTPATRTPSGCCSHTAQLSTAETTATTERPWDGRYMAGALGPARPDGDRTTKQWPYWFGLAQDWTPAGTKTTKTAGKRGTRCSPTRV